MGVIFAFFIEIFVAAFAAPFMTKDNESATQFNELVDRWKSVKYND
jgi:hypothetical protein